MIKNLTEIKKKLEYIKKVHGMAKEHFEPEFQERHNKLLAKLETVYLELQKLGVNPEFSAYLFVFGGEWLKFKIKDGVIVTTNNKKPI